MRSSLLRCVARLVRWPSKWRQSTPSADPHSEFDRDLTAPAASDLAARRTDRRQHRIAPCQVDIPHIERKPHAARHGVHRARKHIAHPHCRHRVDRAGRQRGALRPRAPPPPPRRARRGGPASAARPRGRPTLQRDRRRAGAAIAVTMPMSSPRAQAADPARCAARQSLQ